MKYKNMNEIITDSIRVEEGMISVYPQFGKESKISVYKVLSKFNGKSVYCVNNSTIAFIFNGGYYVIPYIRSAMEVILNNCSQDFFYVPFSNLDYPKDYKAKWEQLKEIAQGNYRQDFKNECQEWCDKHNVSEIPDEILKNCFKIPTEGIKIQHLCYEQTIYPVINGSYMDYLTIEKLGKYCTNNGKVIFIYRDGTTYVCKGYGIISILRNAGYKETGIFVPFSNGEIIQDPDLKEVWDNLKKF